MSLRHVAVASLWLNVLLIGASILFKPLRPASSMLEKTAATHSEDLPSTSMVSVPRPVTPMASELLRSVLTNWNTVQSDDLRTYALNLQAMKCPEFVVQNVIVIEIDRQLAGRAEAAQDRQNLETERRASIKDVLGVEWHDIATAAKTKHVFQASMLFGERVSPERAARLDSLWLKIQDLGTQWSAEDNRQVSPEALAQRPAQFAQLMHELRERATPEEIQELELRLMALDVNDVWDAECLFGCELTGQELRELLRITKGERTPIARRVSYEQEFPKPRPDALQKQERQLRALLGEDRFQGFLRAKDDAFRGMHRSVQKIGGTVEETWKVYDIWRSAKEAAQQVRSNATFTVAQRDAAWLSVRNEAEAAMRRAFGLETYSPYWKIAERELRPLTQETLD